MIFTYFGGGGTWLMATRGGDGESGRSTAADAPLPDRLRRIDLVREDVRKLGPITVNPPARSVRHEDGREVTLEPRGMQVLVALLDADGAIVSRDELVASCWSGRIVGDDSISSVVYRLRRDLKEAAAEALRIETVTKVGFRLIVEGAGLSTRELRTPVIDHPSGSVHPSGAVLVAPEPYWRKPAARWWMIGAIAAVAALVAAWIMGAGPIAPGTVPTMAVDRFAVTGGGPADSAAILQSAVVSASAPGGVQTVPGPGSGSDYLLSGRLAHSADALILFAELRSPAASAPIWSPQVRYPPSASLLGIGAELASAARCVIEGHQDLRRSKSATGLAAWARYCENSTKSDWDEALLLEPLRAAIRAEPEFLLAQITLASALGYKVMHDGGRDPHGLRAEAKAALASAERRDPENPRIYLTRAILTPLTDFKSREVLIARALRSRPSGSGQEANAQGYHFHAVGRLRDSLDAYQRALTIAPGNPIMTMARAEVLSAAGRYREARPIFQDDAATKPDRARIDRIWLTAAITGQDWETANRLIPSVPDDQARAAMRPLVAALASGDKVAAHAAGAAFERIATDSASLSALTVMALAWSGRDLAAIDAAERRFRVKGYNNVLGALYSPGFAAARKTPEFEAMVRRIGLFDYWQSPGHSPDFCTAADAPAFCRKL
jgi:DNA-binding winged helix-turn-helix (wHTH) protein/tetratricopeptide (TPR) repeat protein